MRKAGFFLVSALLLCTSCTKIKQAFNSVTANAETMEEETANNQAGQRFINVNFCSADSMVVLSADIPLANEGSLTDSVFAYIDQCFEGFADAYSQTKDAQKAFDMTGNAIHKKLKEEISQMRSEMESEAEGEELPEYLFTWEYEDEITKEYDMERYVTFINTTYIYQGGAHGMHTLIGTTFDKSTGKRIDKSILTNTQSATFKALYQSELSKYFMSEDDGEATFDLRQYLFVEPENVEISNLRLTDHSIIFQYQPYEIAPYAAGMPMVELNFQQIKPYLTADGLRLIGK
jgi:hypothetical protein